MSAAETSAMKPKAPLRTLVINLDRDVNRMERVRTQFERFPNFQCERASGVLASDLPVGARDALTGRKDVPAGALGTFLAHVRAWEIVASGTEWCLVLEDDFFFSDPDRLFLVEYSDDLEMVFVNQRANPRQKNENTKVPVVYPTIDLVKDMAIPERRPRPPGGDGYLLSPRGARKLIDAAVKDKFAGHVDWRLLRYGLSERQTTEIVTGTLLANRVAFKADGAKELWQWNVVVAGCLSPHVVQSGGLPSSRKISDGSELARDSQAMPKTGQFLIGSAKFRTDRATRAPTTQDFVASDYRVLDTIDVKRMIPYLFDFDREEMVLTVHDDAKSLFKKEPFLYMAQRNDASSIVRIPFASLNSVFGDPVPDVDPVLIFSIGRTGSTLLDGLLGCATPWSVSEPDAITQLTASHSKPSLWADLNFDVLLWHSLSPILGLARSERFTIKFRSQLNGSVEKIVKVFPNARYVFMLRDMISWARSTHRVFRMPPEQVAGRLIQGIRAIKALKSSGVALEIVHYEELVAEPFQTISRILGAGFCPDDSFNSRIAEVMARDSQAGTKLQRGGMKVSDGVENDWLEAFDRIWRARRPAELIEQLGLPY